MNLDYTEEDVVPSNVYVNYESKAAENKSTAWSFLIIGTLGIMIVALSWFNMLPFTIGGRGNWFTHGAMLIFFVIFIFVGIVSARNVGRLKELAGKEASSLSELEKFMTEKFTLDVLSQLEAESQEEAYFKRMQFMREEALAAFPEENTTFIESLLDAHYDKIFG